MNDAGQPSTRHSSDMGLPAVLADIHATSGNLRGLLLTGVTPTSEDWLVLGEFCFSALALCWQQSLIVQRRQP